MLKLSKLMLLTILVLSICLSCKQPTPEPTPIPTSTLAPTNTLVPTDIPIPTSTPTPIPTSTPTPIPTSTPVPLSEIDIEPVVIENGDLPIGFSGGQVRDGAPRGYADLPPAQNTTYQELVKGGELAGGVAIFLYSRQEDIEKAYNFIVDDMFVSFDTKSSNVIGDKATIANFTNTNGTGIVFVRCNAIVDIRMLRADEISVVSYAKRLDKRLASLVCR